ncbi:ras association domain-containing protein 1 [Patagioenas fasciata monilis]|uniref:Ras association domain-containing protein 1 n=1 Tax=Patagioenas fasciata monilis TaxID=372326 RepID=A0A1V4K8Z7_PATFA|nr:ras association domain-containing protein 1 [Patagioenas fasciata monilis]
MAPLSASWADATPRNRLPDEPSEWEKTELDQAQVEQRIKEYNSQINSNLFMSLNKDGSYTGFIKVQLKLVRPVSVPATKRGTVKHLHIFSHTRASEVIDALLRKFTVIDNPRKFALFERSEKDEQVYLRKLGDEEQPLRLRLLAGPSEKVLSFVLKENETGEVNWDAFTLPELHNFLRILQREEEEHVRQLRHRYARCRQKMQEALATLTPGKSLQCRHCSFTCHYRCRALVRLDCSGPPGTGDENNGTEQALEKDTNV